jgi:AraC-like DNA-binding protein
MDFSKLNIARKSGYLDISHLSRLFRKNFDIWPGEYRKRARIGVAADSRLIGGLKSSEIMVK